MILNPAAMMNRTFRMMNWTMRTRMKGTTTVMTAGRMTMTIRTDEDVRKAERFIGEVRYMREAQKRYYHTWPRDRTLLLHVQELEREVDDCLAGMGQEYAWIKARQEQQEQPELFSAE
jgi:hypothetical protein